LGGSFSEDPSPLTTCLVPVLAHSLSFFPLQRLRFRRIHLPRVDGLISFSSTSIRREMFLVLPSPLMNGTLPNCEFPYLCLPVYPAITMICFPPVLSLPDRHIPTPNKRHFLFHLTRPSYDFISVFWFFEFALPFPLLPLIPSGGYPIPDRFLGSQMSRLSSLPPLPLASPRDSSLSSAERLVSSTPSLFFF